MTVRYTITLTHGDDAEIVAARLWVAGAQGVQEDGHTLIGWFEHRVDEVPPGGAWEAQPEEDWLATWREGIEAVRAGRVMIVPSWLRSAHIAGDEEVTLDLDPGVAFGSGHHATTQLCLLALQAHLTPGARVLDVGCGTGVLAIAAALLGAGEVEGDDVDADAVHATLVNARANEVVIDARLGGVEVASGSADLVLANLLTPTLHALAGPLVAAVRPGGILIASGVATERADGVAEALIAAGATLIDRADDDGWAALTLRVHGGAADRSQT
jgi:ribosomal protein L11 methyltransferase